MIRPPPSSTLFPYTTLFRSDVLAGALGVEPVIDQPALDFMQARFARASFQLTPNNLRQVRVPRGARVFGNPAGLAPGFEVALRGVAVMCVPGVPREMKAIFASAIRARLIELREGRGAAAERIARRVYHVFGLGESHIATRLDGLLAGAARATLHYQVKFPETLVKLVIRAGQRDDAEREL